MVLTVGVLYYPHCHIAAHLSLAKFKKIRGPRCQLPHLIRQITARMIDVYTGHIAREPPNGKLPSQECDHHDKAYFISEPISGDGAWEK